MKVTFVEEWEADIKVAVVEEWRADTMITVVDPWRADYKAAIVDEWRADIKACIVEEWREESGYIISSAGTSVGSSVGGSFISASRVGSPDTGSNVMSYVLMGLAYLLSRLYAGNNANLPFLFLISFLTVNTIVVHKHHNTATEFLWYHLFYIAASSCFMYVIHYHVHAPANWALAIIYAISPIGIATLLFFAGIGVNDEYDGEMPYVLLMVFAWFSLIFQNNYPMQYLKCIQIQMVALGILLLVSAIRFIVKVSRKK